MSKAKTQPESISPQGLEQELEKISEQNAQEFIEAAASLTREKIQTKLSDGTFLKLVFGGDAGSVNFSCLQSFGGSLSLPGTVETTAQ